MAGKRYSAGAIFLQVVPVFANVQRAIEDESKNIDRALGDSMEKSGERAGQRAGKAASKSMKDEIGKADLGKDIEQQIRDGVDGIDKALGGIKTQNLGKKLRAEVKGMKAELESLKGIDLKLDDNVGSVQTKVAALRAQIEEMRKRSSVFFDIKGLPSVYRSLAQVETAIKAVNGDIKLDIDTRGADRKIGAFERNFKKTASKAASHLSGSMHKEIAKIGDELSYLQNLRIGIDISGNRARAEIKEISAELEKLQAGSTNIDVKVDTAVALAELVAFEAGLRKIDGEDVTVDVNVDDHGSLNRTGLAGQDAANSFRSFNLILLAAAGIGPALIPVLGAIAGGLLAIGPAAAVAGVGIGAAIIGFSGLSGALQALQAQQDHAATNADKSSKKIAGANYAIVDAVNALKDAQRTAARAEQDAATRVADARRDAARAAEDAAQRVADARAQSAKAIKDALESQKQAQEDYRAAVQDVADAEQALRDARDAAQAKADTIAKRQRQNAVDERQGVLDLFDAQTKYNAVMADGSSTNTNKEQASVNLEKAQIALNDTRDEQAALAKEAADYAKNGVEGTDGVTKAQDDLTAAIQAQKDAQTAVADAAAAVDAARVKGAQDVTRALEDQNRVLADNARTIQRALQDQAQAHADNARAIERAREALRRAREQGVDDLGAIDTQAQAVKAAFDKLGPAGKKFALFLFSLKEGFRSFRDDVQTVMLPAVQQAIEGLISSANGSKIADMIIAMADAFGKFTVALSQSFQGPAWGAFFEMMADLGPKIFKAYGGAFIGFMEAFASILTTAAPFALKFANGLAAMMDAWAGWEASKAGQDALMGFIDYVERVGPAVLNFFGSFAGALGNVLEAMAPYGSIVLTALTGIFDLLAGMDTGILGAILTGLTVLIFASQVAYGVMNLIMAAGALFGSTIGLVVFAIAGIGLALLYLYHTNEDFKKFVLDAWDKISGAFSKAWEEHIKPALEGLWDALNNLWNKVLMPFFAWLGPKIVWVVTHLIPLLGTVFAAVIDGISWYINNALIPAFGILAHGFSDMWAVITFAWGIIEPIFAAIGTVVMWLWHNVFAPAFSFIGAVVKTAFDVISWVWNKVLWPVIKTIGKVIWNLWKFEFKVAFILIKAAFKAVGVAFKWVWEHILKPAFGYISTGVSWLWEHAFKPAFGWISRTWDSMVRGLRKGWNDYGQPIFNWIVEHALPPLQAAFKTAIDAIGAMWEGLKAMVGTPIKFVIEKILNEGIIDSFNKVAGWVGEDGFDHISTPGWMKGYATGGILPGYTPGRDPHVFRSATAGTLALSGGEAIMRPEWTRAVGSGFVDQMNSLARSGGVSAVRGAMSSLGGYWNGGILPLLGASVTSHGSTYPFPAFDLNYPGYADYGKPIMAWRDGIAHPFDFGSDTSYGRGQTIDHGDSTSLYAHMSRVITSLAGQLVKAGQTIGYVGDYGNTGTPPTSHLHFEIRGGGSGIDTSSIVASDGKSEKDHRAIPSWLMSIVKDPLGAFKGWVNDPIKDAAASISGTPLFGLMSKVPSLLGKKVVDKVWDIVPGWVKTTAGWAGNAADWTIDGVKGAAGAVGDAAGAVGSGVSNAAHAVGDALGLANGGILPYNGTMKYDAGGYLPPGLTSVMNLTGKPEPVFTADQFGALGTGGSGGGFTYAPTIHGSKLTAADLVDDMDFARRRIQREGRYGRNKT